MKQAARKDYVEAFARGLEVIKAFDEAVKSRGQTLNLTTLSASEP